MDGAPDPGKRSGCWTPLAAALAARPTVWSSAPTLGDRLEEAMESLRGAAGRAWLGRSYNGLLEALRPQWRGVRGRLKRELRRRALGVMRHMHDLGDWLLPAVDGSVGSEHPDRQPARAGAVHCFQPA